MVFRGLNHFHSNCSVSTIKPSVQTDKSSAICMHEYTFKTERRCFSFYFSAVLSLATWLPYILFLLKFFKELLFFFF